MIYLFATSVSRGLQLIFLLSVRGFFAGKSVQPIQQGEPAGSTDQQEASQGNSWKVLNVGQISALFEHKRHILTVQNGTRSAAEPVGHARLMQIRAGMPTVVNQIPP